jgi:hypothetical protein
MADLLKNGNAKTSGRRYAAVRQNSSYAKMRLLGQKALSTVRNMAQSLAA